VKKGRSQRQRVFVDLFPARKSALWRFKKLVLSLNTLIPLRQLESAKQAAFRLATLTEKLLFEKVSFCR
jgi:hypothetical protein